MRAGPPFRLDGAAALYSTLRELPKHTKRAVLMRTLRTVIKPLASAVQAAAPYDSGELSEGLITGTRLTRRQARMNKEGKGAFEAQIHFGTADPAGMMNEFGNVNMQAQPFFRAEWEGRKYQMVEDIGNILGPQIEAAGRRLHKKNGLK